MVDASGSFVEEAAFCEQYLKAISGVKVVMAMQRAEKFCNVEELVAQLTAASAYRM